MLFRDLYSLYYRLHALTKLKAPENVHYWAKVHLQTWADRELESITRVQVQEWADRLGEKSPSAANRAVHQLAAILNWGARRGYLSGSNPCSGVELFRERSRDRFLLPGELARFTAVLNRQPEPIRHLFWMFLLTGARRSNILTMRWDELDFQLMVWRIPENKFKNGEPHLIPLVPAALAILEKRQAQSQSQWVFPGRCKGSHLKEPKRAWRKVTAEAGLDDVRLHDLRRTVGSYLAIAGESQYVIGKALGHKDQRSTAVYARLNLEPVRRAMVDVSASFLAQ